MVATSSPAPSAAQLTSSTLIDRISIEDMEWLDADTCVVTWSWVDSSFVSASLVTVELEGKDPSVGYFSSYWYADGDAPESVTDRVAEAASLRAADNEPDGDADWDSRGDYEPDDDDRMEAY